MSTPTTGVGWIPEDSFAARLLLVRRQLGLSVKDAAGRCHIHYATWSTWERGSVPQNYPDVVKRISAELGVDRDWLAWGGVLATTRSAAGRPDADQVPYVTKRYHRATAARMRRVAPFPRSRLSKLDDTVVIRSHVRRISGNTYRHGANSLNKIAS